MNKNAKVAIICLVVAAIIAIIPLTMGIDSEFGGADGEAETAITEIDKDYEPWFESILEPPGGETESLLFCLQTAIGAGAFGYGLGFLVARKKFKGDGSDEKSEK